jgi:Icc-related predicted phosphoesterase
MNYLFVSDIHGRDQKLEKELLEISSTNPPKIVFFLGDVVGTESLNKLQKLFYNSVVNPAKKILKKDPNATDSEILACPIGKSQTVSDGIQNIFDFHPDMIKKEKADYVRELVLYKHFGHFCSNLPKTVREDLQDEMEKNAKVWIDIMTSFTRKKTLVVMIEGNWEARTPLDFYPTKENEELKEIPITNRPFYFKTLLNSLNGEVLYVDEVYTINTEREIFVVWPFDCAIKPTKFPKLRNKVNKKIILVSHAQIDWKSIKGDTAMTFESQKIQSNMGKVFKDLNAHTAVHGHLHDRINSNGYLFEGKLIHYLSMRDLRYIEF